MDNENVRRELDIFSVTAKIHEYREEWQGLENKMDERRIPKQIILNKLRNERKMRSRNRQWPMQKTTMQQISVCVCVCVYQYRYVVYRIPITKNDTVV